MRGIVIGLLLSAMLWAGILALQVTSVSAPPKHRSALGGACSWLTCARG